MTDEYRPRPNDHVVEPVFAALRPEGDRDAAEDEPPSAGRGVRAGSPWWKLALALAGLVALAWCLRLVVG